MTDADKLSYNKGMKRRRKKKNVFYFIKPQLNIMSWPSLISIILKYLIVINCELPYSLVIFYLNSV